MHILLPSKYRKRANTGRTLFKIYVLGHQIVKKRHNTLFLAEEVREAATNRE